MSTLCRLIAVVVFPQLIKKLTEEVTAVNPNFKPTDAKMFWGDCLERAMRNERDPVLTDVVTKFCETWKFPPKRTEDVYFDGITTLVFLGLPFGRNRSIVEEFRKQGLSIPYCFDGVQRDRGIRTGRHSA